MGYDYFESIDSLTKSGVLNKKSCFHCNKEFYTLTWLKSTRKFFELKLDKIEDYSDMVCPNCGSLMNKSLFLTATADEYFQDSITILKEEYKKNSSTAMYLAYTLHKILEVMKEMNLRISLNGLADRMIKLADDPSFDFNVLFECLKLYDQIELIYDDDTTAYVYLHKSCHYLFGEFHRNILAGKNIRRRPQI